MNLSRVLYLGFWLPPSLAKRYPSLNIAGQLWESRLLENFSEGTDIHKVSILDRKIILNENSEASPSHAFLASKFSKDLQAPLSYYRLKKIYLKWRREGWKPDCVLVYNTHPVWNAFVRFLSRHDPEIKRILILLDSNQFSQKNGLLKRMRHRLKPFHWTDEAMLPQFHGIASASFSSKEYCEQHQIPWHWFPGGIQGDGLLERVGNPDTSGLVKLGYFGSHSDYAGLRELLEAFLQVKDTKLRLSIAGEGAKTEELKKLSSCDERVEWVGFFKERKDLGFWASQCHVLVNPRPAGYGNENNFPSKMFDYVQLGRTVLSSKTETLGHAFGNSVIWYDAETPMALRATLEDISRMSFDHLLGAGEKMRLKYSGNYEWRPSAQRLQRWIGNL
jgi:glycosyltransferase involved in cell wall biosynthesis